MTASLDVPALRRAGPGDAPALAELATQLGYPSTAAEVAARLARLAASPADQAVLVMEAGGKVLGWAHVGGVALVESEPFAELRGLVVDEAHRGRGLGRLLVAAAEAWARQAGYAALRVRSNVRRTETHRFYEHLGFAAVKTQVAFAKRLDG